MEDSGDFSDVSKVDEEDMEILIKELQQRVKAELRFPAPIVPRTDPDFLSKFIRVKNYNNDVALHSLQRYYANVHRNLNYIKGIRPSHFEKAFNARVVSILKNRTPEGCKVGLVRAKNWRTKDCELRDLQLSSVMLCENYLRDPVTQSNGMIVIFDMEGLAFEHIRKLSIRELKRIMITANEGLPIKVAGVHFINPLPGFWSLYHITLRFLKEKIRKRVQLHYKTEDLFEFVPSNILPESLGGDLPEDEAIDVSIAQELLKTDIPYEEYWNGSFSEIPAKPIPQRKLSRKRSSIGELVYSH